MLKDKELHELIESLDMNDKTAVPILKHENIESYLEPKLNKNDGFIEVRGHDLFVIDPKEGGKFPVLVPNPELHITVNNHVLKEERVVFSKDEIKVQRKSSELPYKIKISKDELSIFIQLNPSIFERHRLKNQKRSIRQKLELEAIQAPCNVEEVSAEIMEEVLKKGIAVEVNTTAIIQELINPTFKPIKIAEGLPLIPSVDSVLDKFFSQEITEVIEEIDGRADYKNRLKIPTVLAGELIAKLHPPKDGKEGFNVYGEILRPKPPKKIELRAKPKVRVTDDGQVIALHHGRPTITGRLIKYIDILEMYEINSDVDMKTGNIYFSGDVLVRGHVKDNMMIESSGSIYIYGNVYNAKLIASQDIHIIGVVINSTIIAGQLSMFYSQIYKITQELFASFKKLTLAMKQLEKSVVEKKLEFNFSQALFTLTEMKFKHIIKKVNELNQIFEDKPKNQVQVAIKLRILMNALSMFQSLQTVRSVESIQTLNSIQFSIKELIDEMETLIYENNNVHIKAANMSTIKTNGEIVIKKDGVIQSQLFAGTNIVFEKKDSVIRGGRVEALKKIKAGTVGTNLGEPPQLYAGEEIKIEKLFQCKIKMPNYINYLDEYKGRIHFHYNPKRDEVVIR